MTNEARPALVVGCGRMGVWGSESVRRFAPSAWSPLSHAEAVRAVSALRLVGVCDEDPVAARRAGVHCDVAAFADLQQALIHTKPVVATVATRTPARAAIIETLLDAGVRALHLEKPLCRSVAELAMLETRLAAHDTACTLGTLRRYMPIYTQARALAWSGRLGDVQQIHVRMGRAPLLWTHAHSLDLLAFFANDREPQSVMAQFETSTAHVTGALIDGDPVIRCVEVDFGAGLSGVITQQGLCDVEISCQSGRIVVEADGRALVCHGPDGDDPYWSEQIREAPAPITPGGTALALLRLLSTMTGAPNERARDRRTIFIAQRLLLATCQSWVEGGRSVSPDNLDAALQVTGRSGQRFA